MVLIAHGGSPCKHLRFTLSYSDTGYTGYKFDPYVTEALPGQES